MLSNLLTLFISIFLNTAWHKVSSWSIGHKIAVETILEIFQKRYSAMGAFGSLSYLREKHKSIFQTFFEYLMLTNHETKFWFFCSFLIVSINLDELSSWSNKYPKLQVLISLLAMSQQSFYTLYCVFIAKKYKIV